MGFQNKHKPTLVLFCGLPGSGKTTTARKCENETDAIRLCTDEWLADLGIDLFDETTRDKLQVRLYMLGKELLQLRQNVILEDGLWLRKERDEKRCDAAALDTHTELHFYDLTFEELWWRISGRNATGGHGIVPISKEQLMSYWSMFERPDEDELSLFDDVIIHKN